MTDGAVHFINGPFFDGTQLHQGQGARFVGGVFSGLVAQDTPHQGDTIVDLDGDILSHGFVDLQVNGGDGVMFNDDPSVETLVRILRAHHRLGAVALLPTLITDTPEKTGAAIAAAVDAVAKGVSGIKGLHLEGPHLSIAKKGAHDAGLIRRMDGADLQTLLDAAKTLPILKVTVAPESVTLDQVATLSRAGVCVALGHTDADFDACQAYFKAGARTATHLFNAMSQLNSRTPGLVGAVLSDQTVSGGVIADGIHVHPATLATAWAANSEEGRFYLVSDAMAAAGTDQTAFHLDGRRITRKDGRLTLDDGTLAGADLDLTTAVRTLVTEVGVPLDQALAAATRVPGALINLPATLSPGSTLLSSVIRISSTLTDVEPLG